MPIELGYISQDYNGVYDIMDRNATVGEIPDTNELNRESTDYNLNSKSSPQCPTTPECTTNCVDTTASTGTADGQRQIKGQVGQILDTSDLNINIQNGGQRDHLDASRQSQRTPSPQASGSGSFS